MMPVIRIDGLRGRSAAHPQVDRGALAVIREWNPTAVYTAAPHLALDKTVNANNHAVKRSPYYGLITPET